MKKVGKDGVITVKDGKTLNDELDVIEHRRVIRNSKSRGATGNILCISLFVRFSEIMAGTTQQGRQNVFCHGEDRSFSKCRIEPPPLKSQ